ncbi:hypothetical protein PANDA_017375 [Ailuropoda melanoleuca]|uniref:Uncharacterized protein n=1 Tax=Ailuropoda melanoleuca TaxID=9646 RepID=D2HXK4_AILME|nr:hypothetical protein PANDA_017375 [Ailuropoda melanoleuca]
MKLSKLSYGFQIAKTSVCALTGAPQPHRSVSTTITPLNTGHTMSLSYYQKLHQHYDSSYRNRDLRTTMSQYQQEKKSSAIYTHGSAAYSSRSSAAHRQESEAFSQASTASYQQQASRATESTHAFAASRKTASAYDYGYSHGFARGRNVADGKVKMKKETANFECFFLTLQGVLKMKEMELQIREARRSG